MRVTSKPSSTFIPAQALGAGVDGLNEGAVQDVYTPDNLKAMRSAGLRPLTYRLRTELGVEVWHWNTQGEWSDHRQGHWLLPRLPPSFSHLAEHRLTCMAMNPMNRSARKMSVTLGEISLIFSRNPIVSR